MEYEGAVGAAKAEAVGHRHIDLRVILAIPLNWNIGKFRIDFIDIGAFADEVVLHHENAIDRLLNARRSEGMAGE